MLMPIYEERREGAGRNEDAIKTISSRYAGGRREINTEPSKVGFSALSKILRVL
jgi:DNA excision repair protein ERCC-4